MSALAGASKILDLARLMDDQGPQLTECQHFQRAQPFAVTFTPSPYPTNLVGAMVTMNGSNYRILDFNHSTGIATVEYVSSATPLSTW